MPLPLIPPKHPYVCTSRARKGVFSIRGMGLFEMDKGLSRMVVMPGCALRPSQDKFAKKNTYMGSGIIWPRTPVYGRAAAQYQPPRKRPQNAR